jgi:AbrB family looped-hinge helix DNA binding protein
MAKVDSKGRIVLPQDVRERLGLDPGTEVDVQEEDGRAVVEPEESADEIIEDLERRIGEASPNREQTPHDELDAEARTHVETIQRQASESTTKCSDSRTERDDATTDECDE